MKLYHFPNSPNAIKVLATLHALDLTFEEEFIDLTKGESFHPDYVAINPNAMIPVLEDGDLTLWESQAIMRYLVNRYGASTLYPQEAAARAEVDRWLDWSQNHFGEALGTLIFQRLAPNFIPGFVQDKHLIELAEPRLERFAKVLEAHLQGRQFIAGDTVTIADFATVAPLVHKDPGQIDLSPYPNIAAWAERVFANSAWQKAMPKMATA